MSIRSLGSCLVVAAWAATAGCSDDSGPGDGDVADVTDVTDDARPDEGGTEDGGGPCTTDDECRDELFCNGEERCGADGTCVPGVAPCDDGVDCTTDVCDEAGDECTAEPDDTVCQNATACDGIELCLPATGCSAGTPLDCDDANPCTVDRCEEAEDGCVYEPRDLDGDTYATADFGCDASGGTDCDDGDATISPGAAEICDDGRDNNCDGHSDWYDAACRPGNDTCADAIALTEGTRVSGSLLGMTDDYGSSCGPGLADAVYSITLAESRNVVVALGAFGAVLAADLETTCGDPAASLHCANYATPMALRFYSLAAGTYYLVVGGTAGEFFVEYSTFDPTTPPANDTCTGAVDVDPAAGPVAGDLLGMNDDYAPTCSSSAGAPEVFYRLVLTEPHSVTIAAESTPADYGLGVALMTTCGSSASQLECATGSPATITRAYLPAGTYFIAVDGQERRFSLNVTLGTPVAPPAHDTCSGAIDVSAGGYFVGDLAGCYRDYRPSCSSDEYSLNADVVYTFTTTAPHDVRVDLRPVASTGLHAVALRRACADPATELRCRATSPSVAFTQHTLPAGTYFLVVSGSSRPGESRFLLELTFGPPTPVPAGDTCATAADISAGGSFAVAMPEFEDDYDLSCAWATDQPDAVFHLDLTAPHDVTLSLPDAAPWSTSMFELVEGSCGPSATYLSCLTSPPLSFSRRSLPAGDYWLFVDAPAGLEDTLEVTVGPPTSACDGAATITVDYAAGSTFTATRSGTTVGRPDDFDSACNPRDTSSDLAYLLVVPVRSGVRITADFAGTDGMLSLLRTCDDPTSELNCQGGCDDPMRACIPQPTDLPFELEPGSYTIVVDGGWSGMSTTHTLTVEATRL
jgi:hypothetical protein